MKDIVKLIDSMVKKRLFWLLAFNFLLRLVLALCIPITYKEAYFWEWSRFLSWGYLDHPPMVAWIIHFFTLVLPERAVLTVRLGALLLGTGSIWLVYRLAYRLFECHKVSFRAALVACCLPVLNAAWFLMLPDTALVFFQLVALNLVAEIYHENRWWHWPMLGIVAGLALLSKLVFILALIPLIVFLSSERLGRWWEWCGAIFLTFLVFSPYLWWNSVHDWDGLWLQLWERHLWDWGFSFKKLTEVFIEQLVAATPILFALIITTLFIDTKEFSARALRSITLLKMETALTLLVLFVAGSFITQTHPHWAILAYPPAALLLAIFWKPWMKPLAGITQGIFVVVVLITVIAPSLVVRIDSQMLSPSLERGLIKGRQRFFGFTQLAKQITQVGIEQGLGPHPLIFTKTYTLAAPLSFAYGEVINMCAYTRRFRRNGDGQLDYIPADNLKNRGGLFLISKQRGNIESLLRSFFQTVKPLPSLVQTFSGQVIGEYSIYRVEGFTRNFKMLCTEKASHFRNYARRV
jgi:Dolichyl-phosphate-mannose-protein mannosyltransferase